VTKTTGTATTEIKTIDIVVFPDWCGGTFAGSYYVDPITLKEDYFNTFASEELAGKWVERAKEIETDESRLLIHLHEGEGNTSTRPHLIAYVDLIRQLLNPKKRLIEANAYHLKSSDPLVDLVKEKSLSFHSEIKVYGYGHHKNDCVPKYGKQATISLSLEESRFEELTEICVGDKVIDRLDIVRQENPEVFWHYSEEHIDQLRAIKEWGAVKLVMDAPKYLFIYCTADQVRAAAKQADSVKQFENLIGGHFKGFDYVKDYFEMCRKHNISR